MCLILVYGIKIEEEKERTDILNYLGIQTKA